MARALVTHSRGWHALAITRSLGRQGVEVYCGEEAPFAPCFFSKYCLGSFQHPSVGEESEAFVDYMVEKVKELKPDDENEPYVLIPVHKETWLFARHRERFEPHITLPLTSYANMAQTHDKGRLALLAEELGIPIPRTQQFTSLDDVYRAVPDMTFPVFLKVREGAAGVGLKKCDTPEELTASFQEFVEGFKLEPETYPLVQDFVDGEDYCVTALFDSGQPVAMMTYHNVRAFPRGTGAGAVRETVELSDAEASARRLLEHLGWHGMAQLDFRRSSDGASYLIELNPRFFGGLTQSIAANVDYPWLLFQMASGMKIESVPEIDYTTRTEAPLVGLLATLDEIAHDDRALDRLRRVRDELGVGGERDPDEGRLKPLWDAIRDAANPKDIRAYLKEMFEVHRDTINDVFQSDDPRPALGVLFPMALMLKHGKLSLGVLTAETELEEEKPRRRFRDQLLRPSWRTVWVTVALFAVCVFLVNAPMTRENVGKWLTLPTSWIHDPTAAGAEPNDQAEGLLETIKGAIGLTAFYTVNLSILYVVSALLLRERPRREPSVERDA